MLNHHGEVRPQRGRTTRDASQRRSGTTPVRYWGIAAARWVQFQPVLPAPKPHPLFIARGNNDSPEWSPDGRMLAFVSRRNTHSFVGVYDVIKQTVRFLAPSIHG